MSLYQQQVAAHAKKAAAERANKDADESLDASRFSVALSGPLRGEMRVAKFAAPNVIYVPSPLTRDELVKLIQGCIAHGVVQVAEVIS